MSIATSTSLSQEFSDLLSAELLIAPDPQWVFATLADAARAGALGIPDMMRGGGAPGAAAAMNQLLGSNDLMNGSGSRFCKVVLEPSQPGKVVLIDRPVYLAADFGESARRLTEGTAIDLTNLNAPTLAQVTVTLREYAGPMKSDGSVVAPLAITEYLKNRARHDLVEYIGALLRRDRNAFVDGVMRDLLLSTSNVTTPGGTATTAMTAGGSPMTDATLAQVRLNLQNRNIPTFADGTYLLVSSAQHEKDLRADSAFREITRYSGQTGPLLSGQFAKYAGFTICTSTAMSTVGVGSGGAVTGYQAVAFGPESIGWAIGQDVEGRRSKSDDFGRQDLVIWKAIEGYQLLNGAFVEKIVTS